VGDYHCTVDTLVTRSVGAQTFPRRRADPALDAIIGCLADINPPYRLRSVLVVVAA
jgi:hypothetical protein